MKRAHYHAQLIDKALSSEKIVQFCMIQRMLEYKSKAYIAAALDNHRKTLFVFS